ncbi:bifunctional folylpolyglutamate synthase/dihydrofolate synthase [Atopobacter phocae]|uniref:bifunctional folylpolyglutamate synthase/dihydrofolate synthase n=1 Tax=Atopobacter phocae TaxID=136492 RepID=UPI0004721AA2|nr:Mur ligase family protein [Atopobacter phocae]
MTQWIRPHTIDEIEVLTSFIFKATSDEHKIPRMRELFDYFNQMGCYDQTTFIHVVGTNGKGSTGRTLATLLTQMNQATVLHFTSPHLLQVTERISADLEAISSASFIQSFNQLVELIRNELTFEPEELGFFEWLFSIYLFELAQRQSQFAIVEAGIGGLFDVTNVVPGAYAILTNIARDHEEMLGHTLEAIAIQKLGVLKPKQKMVIGPLSKELSDLAQTHAHSIEAYLFKWDENFEANQLNVLADGTYQFNLSIREMNDLSAINMLLQTHLIGSYQVTNASLAVYTYLLIAQDRIAPIKWTDSFHKQLQMALQQVTWSGRLEAMNAYDAPIYIDAAHNLEAVQQLMKQLDAPPFSNQSITLVYAALKRKHIDEILTWLTEVFLPKHSNVQLLLTTIDHVGAADFTDYAPYLTDNISYIEKKHLETMFRQASSTIISFGSLYFVAELLTLNEETQKN